MRAEIQVSDMLSRVIERIQPTLEPISEHVVFDFQDNGTVDLKVNGKVTYSYPPKDIRKEGFFRAHSIPNGARWVRNPNPRNLLELFVKRQIVYTPQDA